MKKLSESVYRSPKWLQKFADFEFRTGEDIKGEPSEKQKEKYPEYEIMGNPVNLMIADSIKGSGGKIFKTFEMCLIDLNKSLG